MHILMLCPDCYMIDRRVTQQARTLVEAGHKVTLLSGFECERESHYQQDGVDIHRYFYQDRSAVVAGVRALAPKGFRPPAWARNLFHRFRRIFEGGDPFGRFVLQRARQFPADVVHVHDLALLRHGLELAQQWETPLVFDAHEIYYEEDGITGYQRRRLQRDERRAMDRLDLFITVNDLIADYYEAKYHRRPLVLLNAPYLPPEGFDRHSRQTLRQRAGLEPGAKIALFQGWFSHERNLLNLIRAVEFFPPDAYLVFIGYGEFEEQMTRLAASLPWGRRVRFLGRVESDDILELTAGADVGVIPYLPTCLNSQLCSPNKFFEFTNAGVPFVSHHLPFMQQLGGQHGIVLTGDFTTPEGMAQPIVRLLTDDELRAGMRGACLKARAELNWQVEGRKLLAAYQPVLAGARQRASRPQ